MYFYIHSKKVYFKYLKNKYFFRRKQLQLQPLRTPRPSLPVHQFKMKIQFKLKIINNLVQSQVVVVAKGRYQ